MGPARKFHRKVFARAKVLVAEAGGTCHFDPGGHSRHAKLRITLRGSTRCTPIAGSPTSDMEDAIRMKLADVRRILREMTA